MSNTHPKAEEEAPAFPRAWRSMVERLETGDTTIHSAELASASRFGVKQFLLLRVLWRIYQPSQIIHVADMHKWVAQATEMLDGYKSWNKYCDSIGSASTPEGTFAIARYYQREVARTEEKIDPQAFDTPISSRTRGGVKRIDKGVAGLSLGPPETPTKKGPAHLASTSARSLLNDNDDSDDEYDEDSEILGLEDESSPSTIASPSPIRLVTPITRELANILYPPTKDEQIVNTALIVFLNALTIHFPLSSKWTLHRKPLTAVFKNAEFEARTGGYLDSPGGKPRVLIEVKPILRSWHPLRIQIQESAQMVAWIKSDSELAQKTNRMYAIPSLTASPDKRLTKGRRFHVSQDRHLVYVTVARYGQEYLDYLVDGTLPQKEKDDEDPSFMNMDQYGPWDTTDEGSMRQLGPILLAITLRAEEESKKEKLEDKQRRVR